MLLGVILAIGIESTIAVLLLKNYHITSSNTLSSLLGPGKAPNISILSNSILHSNSTLRSASPKISVRSVALSGTMNVKGVNLTNEGNLHGTIFYNTTLQGFNTTSNATENYSITITDYSSALLMLVSSISSGTRNFTIVGISPQVPSFINPSSSKNFTLSIRMPNSTYTGTLNISFNATLLKGPE